MSAIQLLHAELDLLPTELRQIVSSSLQQFEQKINQQGLVFPDHDRLIHSIVKVWSASQFVSQSCLKKPALLFDLIDSGDLYSGQVRDLYSSHLQQQVISSEAELMTVLRHFRGREMVRIAWRDLAGWSDLPETLADLTALAETCIQFALDYLYQQACARRGTPVLSDASAQQLVVLGMGKLGAWELNYSSDIDLIFAFAEEGVLTDRKQTSYGEFFTRLCRSLVKVLDEVTVDGFVFRTDIRLRPFGNSGPIVMTFDGMEAYYQTQAREWERYAMIKARQVAGDFNTGSLLMAMLKPFVYRRYLDYGAFEELRSLKLKIHEDLQRKDRLDNIKLGAGGIREIEFIGQAFQLIRGGQEVSLQERSIIKIINTLGDLDLLPKADAEQLITAYVFLRRAENHIQQYQDKQTHDLPKDPQQQLLLALSMGFASWTTFKTELDQVRNFVHGVFDCVFSVPDQEQQQQHPESTSAWIARAGRPVLLGHLMKLGYTQAEQILDTLLVFKKSAAIKRLSTKGAGVMDRLMPQLLEQLVSDSNAEQTFTRILALFETVAGRNVYLSLLSENPQALGQLIKLSSASPWICNYLSRYPMLFDELLDTRTLYEPLKQQALHNQLATQLAKIADNDEEQLMFALRKFKQINVLRVAAADIMGVIQLRVVSDYLTFIAEAILQQVVKISWQLIVAKHGLPANCTEPMDGFAVLGFGKLGGREFSYSSDLDMVFLYDCQDANALTDGKRPISCIQFYTRLGQKVMHILQTNMLCGLLYEADMRLRPSGNSGLLVTHVNVYEAYLRNDAWTWEHQALLRARFITGDMNIKATFAKIRLAILSLPRAIEPLKQEVREMREKMRDTLAVKDANKFDIKQSKGGIADIEFIVQFHVLARAAENQALLDNTDIISLLNSLQSFAFISTETAETLTLAYCNYRDRGHRETLQGNRAIIATGDYTQQRAQVEKIWRDCME